LGLLGRCGDAAALERAYRRFEVTQHSAGTAPYAPFVALPGDEDISEDVELGVLMEQSAGGQRFGLCVGTWLGQDVSLFIGVDPNSDGHWDELLATGLTASLDWEAEDLLPSGGELKLAGEVLTVRYIVEHEGDYSVKSSTLKLSELRRDTDSDGLNDIVEGLLRLNPASADSDGDGLLDTVDPAPNADPARMGPVERAVVRGLRQFTLNPNEQRDWNGPRYVAPVEASFVGAVNFESVTFAPTADVYGINLPAAEALELYPYQYPQPGARLTWIDMHADPPWMVGAGGAGHLYYGEAGSAEQALLWREQLRVSPERAGHTAFHTTDAVLVIEQFWQGGTNFYGVYFNKLGAEYYPSGWRLLASSGGAG
jgi:hypothetical protein